MAKAARFPADGPILKLGDTGSDVVSLQTALSAAGFSPGAQDSDFGAGTEAAVIAFQKSVGLLSDGVVGPRTRSALSAGRTGASAAAQAARDIPAADDTASMTVQIASRMLPSAHLDNIKSNLPLVLDALRARALSDRGMILVALSTIRAETSGFVPIDEGISRYNTSPGGKPFDLYDFRRDIGNNGKGQGAKYKGRGFVQLTGQTNYKNIGDALQIPLAAQPELANEPTNAARILAEFMKTKEMRIKNDLIESDLKDARRAVNGGSHGLDDFIAAFRTGDRLMPLSG